MSKYRGYETWGTSSWDTDLGSRMENMCNRSHCEGPHSSGDCNTCLFDYANQTQERKAAFLAWEEGEEE